MSPHDADDVTQRSLGHIGVSGENDDALGLLQIVSHEFRTPLTVLLAGVDILRKQAELSGDLERVLDAMGRASRRLDRLVSQASSTIDVGQTRRVTRMHLLLDEISDELSVSQQARVEFDIEPEHALVIVPWEATRKVVGALVDNALKFSPPNSRVLVSVLVEGDDVIIKVADEGPGIDESFRAAAFEPFSQGDRRDAREHEGLGLGLFTARRWADEAGGELELGPTGDGMAAVFRMPNTG